MLGLVLFYLLVEHIRRWQVILGVVVISILGCYTFPVLLALLRVFFSSCSAIVFVVYIGTTYLLTYSLTE